MTNKSKVAELLEGVEADFLVPAFGRGVPAVEYVSKGSIERVLGPVLVTCDMLATKVNDLEERLNDQVDKVESLNEHISAQAALLVQQEREIEERDKRLDRLYGECANLSRACADLQATKDDYYRNGVAQELAQMIAMPVGWKLVPIEPTPKMKAAGQAEINCLINDGINRYWQDIYGAGYKAMLSAAPQPPMAEQAEPRAMKLLRKGVPFFVVKASEPYARQVVQLIKADQGDKWTADDETYAESVLPPVGVSLGDALGKVLAGDVGPHKLTPGAVEEAYDKAREANNRGPLEPGSERHFHILMAGRNLNAVVGNDYQNVIGLCADVWQSATTEAKQADEQALQDLADESQRFGLYGAPSVNDELLEKRVAALELQQRMCGPIGTK